MMMRILAVGLAAAALTFTGCNNAGESPADETVVETTEVTTEGTEDTAPVEADAPAEAPADAPAAPADPAAAPADTATAPADPAAAAPADAAAAAGEVTLPSGTTYVDVEVGTGEEAVAGKTVSVHYTGTLTNGTKFDSSLDRGEPIEFALGSGRVIQGWDEGIAGMKVGGKRKLTIPPAAGYGDSATGPIPPNSTLLFDVELMGVQ